MYFDETAWVAIAFLLFFVLVWKKGKKAILSLLDERSLLIEKELNEAKSLKEEAMEELRLALQNQKNVSDEAENLIKNAKETAKKIQEEANLKSLEMIKRKEEQAKQKILSLEAEAIKNIKEITSSIVIESSKTYIKQKLDSKENINLISKASNEIKSSILPIFKLCFLAKSCNSLPLDIVPSSFMISHITAELFFFASLDISTEASV